MPNWWRYEHIRDSWVLILYVFSQRLASEGDQGQDEDWPSVGPHVLRMAGAHQTDCAKQDYCPWVLLVKQGVKLGSVMHYVQECYGLTQERSNSESPHMHCINISPSILYWS